LHGDENAADGQLVNSRAARDGSALVILWRLGSAIAPWRASQGVLDAIRVLGLPDGQHRAKSLAEIDCNSQPGGGGPSVGPPVRESMMRSTVAIDRWRSRRFARRAAAFVAFECWRCALR
jgi:hypothetical protein